MTRGVFSFTSNIAATLQRIHGSLYPFLSLISTRVMTINILMCYCYLTPSASDTMIYHGQHRPLFFPSIDGIVPFLATTRAIMARSFFSSFHSSPSISSEAMRTFLERKQMLCKYYKLILGATSKSYVCRFFFHHKTF